MAALVEELAEALARRLPLTQANGFTKPNYLVAAAGLITNSSITPTALRIPMSAMAA